MRDCAKTDVDIIILVSADSDLITPIEFIKQDYPNVNIKVFFPPHAFSKEISNTVKSYKQNVTLLKKHKIRFNNAVMPDLITKDGITYSIPSKWILQPANPT